MLLAVSIHCMQPSIRSWHACSLACGLACDPACMYPCMAPDSARAQLQPIIMSCVACDAQMRTFFLFLTVTLASATLLWLARPKSCWSYMVRLFKTRVPPAQPAVSLEQRLACSHPADAARANAIHSPAAYQQALAGLWPASCCFVCLTWVHSAQACPSILSQITQGCSRVASMSVHVQETWFGYQPMHISATTFSVAMLWLFTPTNPTSGSMLAVSSLAVCHQRMSSCWSLQEACKAIMARHTCSINIGLADIHRTFHDTAAQHLEANSLAAAIIIACKSVMSHL